MAFARHLTLAAGQVTTVAIPQTSGLELLNRDGASEVYFRVDGANPTVGGDNCEVLPASTGARTAIAVGWLSGRTSLKLIAAAAVKVSVTARSGYGDGGT